MLLLTIKNLKPYAFFYDILFNISWAFVSLFFNKAGCVRIDTILRRVRATMFAMEKTISITHYECVFVALGIQHELRLRHIIICGLPDCTILFHLIS